MGALYMLGRRSESLQRLLTVTECQERSAVSVEWSPGERDPYTGVEEIVLTEEAMGGEIAAERTDRIEVPTHCVEEFLALWEASYTASRDPVSEIKITVALSTPGARLVLHLDAGAPAVVLLREFETRWVFLPLCEAFRVHPFLIWMRGVTARCPPDQKTPNHLQVRSPRSGKARLVDTYPTTERMDVDFWYFGSEESTGGVHYDPRCKCNPKRPGTQKLLAYYSLSDGSADPDLTLSFVKVGCALGIVCSGHSILPTSIFDDGERWLQETEEEENEGEEADRGFGDLPPLEVRSGPGDRARPASFQLCAPTVVSYNTFLEEMFRAELATEHEMTVATRKPEPHEARCLLVTCGARGPVFLEKDQLFFHERFPICCAGRQLPMLRECLESTFRGGRDGCLRVDISGDSTSVEQRKHCWTDRSYPYNTNLFMRSMREEMDFVRMGWDSDKYGYPPTKIPFMRSNLVLADFMDLSSWWRDYETARYWAY